MFRYKEKGQGLPEYLLVLVLITVIVIVVCALLGPAIVDVIKEKNQQPAVNTQIATYCNETTCLTVEKNLQSDDSTTDCNAPSELVYNDEEFVLNSCNLEFR